MNYQKIYDDICKRGQERILPKEIYTEKHHIIPKCLGGTNQKSNLTKLTDREHFLVHLILARKLFPNNSKLWYALTRMIYSENSKIQRYIPSGRLYESLKIEINNALEMPRKYRLGKTNIEIYGKEKALEISRKLSISKKGKPSHNLGRKFPPEFGQNISKRRTGTKMSDEAKKRRSERQMGENNPFFGKTHTPETKQKISDANSGDKHCFYGKHFTEEHKKAIGDAQRGKTVSRESIEKRKITIANNPKPYSEKRRQEMREFFTQNNPRSRKCSINNIEFKSMSEAARILNLSNKIIRNRILSDKNKWSEWILI